MQLRQCFHAGVGQRVDGQNVAGLQERHDRHGEPLLRAVDDQHLFAGHADVAIAQMFGDGLPFMPAPALRRGMQQRIEIARRGERAQPRAQQLDLTGQRRIVEGQIDRPGARGILLEPESARQRRIAHEGASSHFADYEPHRFEFTVHTRRGRQRDAVLLHQCADRGELRAGRQRAGTYVADQIVDDGFVAGFGHRCI